MSGVDALLKRARIRGLIPDPAEQKRLREHAGLSLREVAKALGVSHAAVRGWESGSCIPREPVRSEYVRLLKGLAELNGGRKR